MPDCVRNDRAGIIEQTKETQHKPSEFRSGGFLFKSCSDSNAELYDTGGNKKCYQWIRPGLEVKGIKSGLAVNLDEYGRDPSVESNFGLFLRKDIF